MRKHTCWFLILVQLALAARVLDRVHNWSHELEDTAAEVRTPLSPSHPITNDRHHHDASNCQLHALLLAPTLPIACGVAMLLLIGLTGLIRLAGESVAPVLRLVRPLTRGPPPSSQHA